MTIATLNLEITKVAEQYVDEHRDDIAKGLAERVQLGIERAEQDKITGNHMDLATFKKRLYSLDLTK